MTLHQELIEKIYHGHNPYNGYPSAQWAGTWYDDPGAKRAIFERALKTAKPRIVVEVGSFVGESAIWMAEILQKLNPEAVILCVDTWMGGIDHWMKVPEKLKFHFGRPSLYYQFLANVIEAKFHGMILPVSLDSINAARLLKYLNIQPDMVYIDGSHEQGDVLRDYHAYWDLIRSGGVFLVDDLTGWFPGVLADWDTFLRAHPAERANMIVEGEKGMLVKL